MSRQKNALPSLRKTPLDFLSRDEARQAVKPEVVLDAAEAAQALRSDPHNEKMLRLHFGSLLGHTIHEINPQRIDRWLDELKEKCKVVRRASFDHELTLLSNVIRW